MSALGSSFNSVRALFPKQLYRQEPSDPPEFLLDDDSGSARLPSSAALLITPVILLNEHGGAAALLEFFLFVVTSEFALDKDGSLCHLFIKCILQGEQEEAEQ